MEEKECYDFQKLKKGEKGTDRQTATDVRRTLLLTSYFFFGGTYYRASSNAPVVWQHSIV